MSCRLIDIFNNLIVHRVGPISVYGFFLETIEALLVAYITKCAQDYF
jgi:hypothetical protein